MSTDSTLDPLRDWLRLAFEPKLGRASYALLRHVGSPTVIMSRSPRILACHLAPALARRLAGPPEADLVHRIDRACAWATEPGHAILTLCDPAYPAHLLTLADPPLVLFVAGDPRVLTQPGLAIVGARHASAQGLDTARAFGRTLARQGVCIISGLAQGIDAAAHQGALDAGEHGAGTIAVMGTGVDTIYPARHRALAERIAGCGALVSELPPDAGPRRFHFPRRNRLVAGLARGVLVVEAAQQSGSLITARLAAETGREVFAIPGSIHSPLSKGCHALLREGAKLVETAQDILDELPGMGGAVTQDGACTATANTGSEPDAPESSSFEAQDPVLSALGFDPVSLDTLLRRSRLGFSALASRLMALELEGIIVRQIDGRYLRRGQR